MYVNNVVNEKFNSFGRRNGTSIVNKDSSQKRRFSSAIAL